MDQSHHDRSPNAHSSKSDWRYQGYDKSLEIRNIVPLNNKLVPIPLKNKLVPIPLNNKLVPIPLNNKLVPIPLNN